MGATLYLSCDCGISADMAVGALIGLGADTKRLEDALASLPLDGYETKISHVFVESVAATDFDVRLDAAHDGHDHDMEWLYGGLDEADAHSHGHAHGHAHADGEHHHRHHHHEHRTLADIFAVIDAGELTPGANALAKRIFEIVADAEAQAHGCSVDEVSFHEAGAVDSIVDTVACAVCVDDLGIERAYIGPLAEGTGQIRTQHGILAVPVPAVVSIVQAHGLVMRQTGRTGELVTPTGAAIAAALRTEDGVPGAFRILASGTGVGKRAYTPRSTLRAYLIEEADDAAAAPAEGGDTVWKLETEVDDTTGEALGYVLERLFAAGALEAHYLPIVMKKGRPAWQVQVLCTEDARAALEEILFEDTSTIGIRRARFERTVLPRTPERVRTPLGAIDVKTVALPDGSIRRYPEYESVAALAREKGLAFQDAIRTVTAALLS